jgi:glucokinase-like ROK family protein
MTQTRTGDQALIREINLSIILNALHDQAPRSRAALAALTGLNKTTVSSLVRQLIAAGFIRELGTGKPEDTGRPGILLQLDPAAGRIIGAEIGVDFIAVRVTDFAIHDLWHDQVPLGRATDQARALQQLCTLIRAALAATAAPGRITLGLGLGVPGLVDVGSGTLLFAPNLGWRDVPLRAYLEAAFDFPVVVDNEANLATLGESAFGVARGAASVLYVSAGVGLGGGIVLDGQVLPGATGFAGEVGHMTLLPDGLPCACGNRGCWETVVSQEAVFRRVRAAVAAGHASTLQRATGDDLTILTIPLVVQAAAGGDAVARAALDETAIYLGIGLANLINALNPEIVVFGGILSLAWLWMQPTIERIIAQRALSWAARATRLLVAAHGVDACVMGGIATVYRRILSRPFPRPVTANRPRPAARAARAPTPAALVPA